MQKRSRAGIWISVAFLAALFMGAGPGLALANRPESVPIGFGLALPALYAWGILWYLVEAACVVLAYVFVWRDPSDS
jgi:hypothetical protein